MNRIQSKEPRQQRVGPSRRRVLATAGAAVVASLAGCSGSGANPGETTSPADDADAPTPPWTTESLRDYIDESATFTIYAGTGDDQQWHDLVDVINDEFGTDLSAEVFGSDGATVSQRIIQERQANDDRSDVISYANDIRNEIRIAGPEEGLSVAQEWYEWGIDQNFWFADVLPDGDVLPWLVSGFNGGASLVMPVNSNLFEERGLPYPTNYNDLLDDTYEGVEAVMPGYIVSDEIGWIMDYHANEAGMDPLEWMRTMIDHLDFSGANSYTSGARSVAQGEKPFMFFNFPQVIVPFVSKHPLEGHFVDPVKMSRTDGPLQINRKAPNPWVARFFLSAVLEEPVQRRIIHDVNEQTPARLDLDYSAQNPDVYTMKRLNANVMPVGFWEESTYVDLGERAKEADVFEY